MLENRFGVRLILHLGQTVPAPPSPSLLSSLSAAEVISDASGASGFQLTFALSQQDAPDPRTGGVLEVMSRVRIGVLIGGVPEMLIDGVVTQHDFSPQGLGSTGTLTVTGRDLSLLLDLEERNAAYENQSDAVIVNQILSRYSQLALVPDVAQTAEAQSMVQRIPRQAETDLEFIQRLAERNGFMFYIEPLAFGVSRAYFGSPQRGPRLPALSWNLGPGDNLSSLRASADGLAAVDVESLFLDSAAGSKSLRRIPPSASADDPHAAGALPALRKIIHRQAAPLTEGRVASYAAALIANAPDPIALEGTVDIGRYGNILRPRSVVSLSGAGSTYDGDHVVRRVSHRLQPGSYIQRFTLGREGTGAARKAAS